MKPMDTAILESQKMKNERFIEGSSDFLFEQQTMLFEACLKEIQVKSKDYARSPNVFAQFVRIAEKRGLTPEDIALIFFDKPMDAIEHYVKTGRAYSETIDTRFVDAINYLVFIYVMIKKRQEESA